MASREVQKLLFDMKQAGELIGTFVAGRSFEESSISSLRRIIDFRN